MERARPITDRIEYLNFLNQVKIIGPLVFFAFISKSVNNQSDNPYIFGKIFSSSTTSISNVFVEIEVVELENIFPKMCGLSHLLFTDFEINAKNTKGPIIYF